MHHPAMPLSRAESLTEFGAFLIRRNELARARPVLAEAVQLAEDCGAAWHAERARVAWRRAGGRARTTPVGALSPQEKAVADLARAGRTNKEIAAQALSVGEHSGDPPVPRLPQAGHQRPVAAHSQGGRQLRRVADRPEGPGTAVEFTGCRDDSRR